MKLLTHNFLSSRFLKNVNTGYPLTIKTATNKEVKDVEFNEQFVQNMVPKLDYAALRAAAVQLGEGADLPEQQPADWEHNEEFLKEMHRVLLCVEVMEGELECPESGRVFPIRDGIPNMLCNEDEVD